jgi:2-polyprenyl-3-methyl-5-hydroxy-6-metoxy-1,4-benzoquinol methylase
MAQRVGDFRCAVEWCVEKTGAEVVPRPRGAVSEEPLVEREVIETVADDLVVAKVEGEHDPDRERGDHARFCGDQLLRRSHPAQTILAVLTANLSNPGSAQATHCPACGGDLAASFVVRGFQIVRCRSCATLVVTSAGEASALYTGSSYYVNSAFGERDDAFNGYRDYLADRAHSEEKFSSVLARIEQLIGTGTLVDVGAGPGFLVEVAGRRGWAASGVDVNEWAVDYARTIVGVDVRRATLAGLQLPEDSVDAITMLDLLEHVRDPAALIHEAARVLRPGGVLCVVTPDAGSAVARALRARWPEVARVPEHLVLFSGGGLATLLRSQGLAPVASGTVGKRSTLSTLLADADPIAPAVLRRARRLLGSRLGSIELRVNPRGKVAVFAVRSDDAVVEDLAKLAGATRLSNWMAEQFAADVRGAVLEVGAGIGTFTSRLVDAGAAAVTAVEPDPACATTLQRRFAAESRVNVVRDELPDLPVLAERGLTFDLIVCQNVLEHIDDDQRAVAGMAARLRPGGMLDLLLPAHPRLFGSLDREYEHRRRYTRRRAELLLGAAGLEVVEMHSFNALGIVGWWASGRLVASRLDTRALKAFDAVVPLWRWIEAGLRPRVGLSLVVRARKPA